MAFPIRAGSVSCDMTLPPKPLRTFCTAVLRARRRAPIAFAAGVSKRWNWWKSDRDNNLCWYRCRQHL